MYPTNLWLFEQKSTKASSAPTPVMDKNHIGSSLPSPSGRRSTNHFHHCYSNLVSSAPPIGWGFMFPEGVLGHAKGRLSLTDCQKNPALSSSSVRNSWYTRVMVPKPFSLLRDCLCWQCCDEIRKYWGHVKTFRKKMSKYLSRTVKLCNSALFPFVQFAFSQMLPS